MVTEVWHEVFVIILFFFRSVLVILLLFRRAYAYAGLLRCERRVPMSSV